MHTIPAAPHRWYQEPLMWLVVAIPALTVPAGLATWYLAATTGHADPVADPVRRVAQVQTADLAADAEAARRGLAATLHVAADGLVAVELGTAVAPGDVLLLSLRHPTEAGRDHTAVLAGDGRHYRARLAVDPAVRWDVVLAEGSGRWRLVGRGSADAGTIALVPALGRS